MSTSRPSRTQIGPGCCTWPKAGNRKISTASGRPSRRSRPRASLVPSRRARGRPAPASCTRRGELRDVPGRPAGPRAGVHQRRGRGAGQAGPARLLREPERQALPRRPVLPPPLPRALRHPGGPTRPRVRQPRDGRRRALEGVPHRQGARGRRDRREGLQGRDPGRRGGPHPDGPAVRASGEALDQPRLRPLRNAALDRGWPSCAPRSRPPTWSARNSASPDRPRRFRVGRSPGPLRLRELAKGRPAAPGRPRANSRRQGP